MLTVQAPFKPRAKAIRLELSQRLEMHQASIAYILKSLGINYESRGVEQLPEAEREALAQFKRNLWALEHKKQPDTYLPEIGAWIDYKDTTSHNAASSNIAFNYLEYMIQRLMPRAMVMWGSYAEPWAVRFDQLLKVRCDKVLIPILGNKEPREDEAYFEDIRRQVNERLEVKIPEPAYHRYIAKGGSGEAFFLIAKDSGISAAQFKQVYESYRRTN